MDYRKESWNKLPDTIEEPAWLQISHIVADWGGLLFLVALALGGLGVHRLRIGKGTGLLKATMVIALVLALAYIVAVWAMTGKPNSTGQLRYPDSPDDPGRPNHAGVQG